MEIRKAVKLIELYRKQKNYSISQLLKMENGAYICSRTTYGKLLKGKAIRENEEIIYYIFERLKKPFFQLPNIIDFKPLSKAMEYNDNKQAVTECQKLLNVLDPYKTNALYDIYYRQLTFILNYYQNNICLNEDEALRELDFIPLVEKDLSELMYVMLMYSHNRGHLLKISQCEELLLGKSHHLLALIFEFCYYLNEQRYGESFRILGKIDDCISEDNVLTMIYFLPYKIRLYQISHMEYDDLLKKCLILIDIYIHEISTSKMNSTYANLIIIQLFNKDYFNALNFIDCIKEMNGIRRIHMEIYKMFCVSQLKLEYIGNTDNIKTSMYDNFPEVIDIYNYFNQSEASERTKNNKLLYLAKNKLKKGDDLYWFMVEEEITKNCDKIKRYKDLRDFKMIKEAKTNEK